MLANLALKLLVKQGKKDILGSVANKVLHSNLTNSMATIPKLRFVKSVFGVVEKRNVPLLKGNAWDKIYAQGGWKEAWKKAKKNNTTP